MAKKKECEHTFKYTEDSKYQMAGCGETVERKVICTKCELKSTEVWVWSGVFMGSGKQVG